MSGTINTAVEMANLALAHLKEVPIRDFDFSSVASRWFRSHYAAYRDAYLALHDWDFAMRLAPLPAEVEAPPFRWRYQYKLPTDCLRIPQQNVLGKVGGSSIPHEISGRRLLSDHGPPFPFRYVGRISRETDFSPLFVHGFAQFLAAGCAHVITGKNSRAVVLKEAAEDALKQAGLVDTLQGTPLAVLEPDIIAQR